MKKSYITTLAALIASGSLLTAATVTWDGGASTNDLGAANNWSDDTAPVATNDYVIDSNTSFGGTGGWLTTLGTGNTAYGSLTISAAGTGINAGRFAIRGGTTFGRMLMSGDLTFTGANLTEDITLQSSTTKSLNFELVGGNRSIVNDTSAVLILGDAIGFGFSAYQSTARTLFFDGSGDITIGSAATFTTATTGDRRKVGRLWTADSFTGTLTIEDGTTVNLTTDIRVQGGTLAVQGTDTIAEGLNIGYGSTSAGTLDFSGLSNTLGDLNDFSDVTGGVDLIVDGTTSVVFDDFRQGANANVVDIIDWDEGNTSLTFSGLGGAYYGGTLAEGEIFDGITIDGGNAYLTDIGGAGGADWALSSIPEPSSMAMLFGAVALGMGVIRRRRR